MSENGGGDQIKLENYQAAERVQQERTYGNRMECRHSSVCNLNENDHERVMVVSRERAKAVVEETLTR